MMFIPNTIPATLAEMLAFLQPTVEDGLFDSVEYDDADSPTKIVCTQNGNAVLEIAAPSSGNFYVVPYIASGVKASSPRVWTNNAVVECMRCKSGVYLSASVSSSYYYTFVISKTSSGQTGFIHFVNERAPVSIGNFSRDAQYYTTCFGDNTSLAMYTNGFYVHSNYANSDRTILTKLPVVGERGSTDYFTGAFVRNTVQTLDAGEQIIGGKQYGCCGMFAILDE